MSLKPTAQSPPSTVYARTTRPQMITRYSTGTPSAIDMKLDNAKSRTEPNINWLGPVSHENILCVPSPKRLRMYSTTVLTRERRHAWAKKTYPKKNAGTARNMRKTPITPCRYANPAPPVKVQTENPITPCRYANPAP